MRLFQYHQALTYSESLLANFDPTGVKVEIKFERTGNAVEKGNPLAMSHPRFGTTSAKPSNNVSNPSTYR